MSSLPGDAPPKYRREMLARFFEEPSRPALRDVFRYELVEDNDLEFKREEIEPSKLAKHIIAMANRHGGVIVLGVTEDGDQIIPEGLVDATDLSSFEKRFRNYLPKMLNDLVRVDDFFFEETEYARIQGKRFRVITVEYDPRYLPFMAARSGANLSDTTIYIRRFRSSSPADYAAIQDLLNRRIETEYSTAAEMTLEEHLADLKVLYRQIERDVPAELELATFDSLWTRNPDFPEEDFEAFIRRAIQEKKELLMRFLRGEGRR